MSKQQPSVLSDSAVALMRKSHRNLGIFLVIFLVLIAVTGILLNHTDFLKLDQRSVPAFIAARYYSDDANGQEISGYKSDGKYFYVLAGTLYVNSQPIVDCQQLQGVVGLAGQTISLCDSELLLLTPDQQLIEVIGAVMGVPDNLVRLGVVDGQLLLQDPVSLFSFDLDTLQLQPTNIRLSGAPVRQAIPDSVLLAGSVSWQQFILDLHSGVFIGNSGKWLSDLVAVFVIVMAISGLVMWRNPR